MESWVIFVFLWLFILLSMIITKNAGLAACHEESQTQETSAGTKERGLFRCHDLNGMADWENGRLSSQWPSPFHLTMVLVGVGKGRLFSYPIILLSFGALRLSPFTFLAFGVLEHCPFIFLAFGARGVSTSPCAILANGGARAAGPAIRKPGDAADLSPPPDGGHGACTSRGASWGLWGSPRFWGASTLCTGPVQPTSLKWPARPGTDWWLPMVTRCLQGSSSCHMLQNFLLY